VKTPPPEKTELDQLEQKAIVLDNAVAADNAAPDPGLPPSEIEVAPSVNAEFHLLFKQAIGLLVLGVSSKYGFVRQHYTPQAVDEIAAAMIGLADEYGIDLQAWIGEGGGKLMAWVRLSMACGLPLLGCLEAFRQQAKEQGKEPPGETPQEVPPASPAMEG